MDSTGSRILQLLFLLNTDPSGISLSTAEPQMRGSIFPDLHRYRPGPSVMGRTSLPQVCRTLELQGFLMVLILIVLQVSGGLVWVFDYYL